MPIITLSTNVVASKISSHFPKLMAETVGKILSKPAERVMVIIKPGENVTFGGTNDPCGFCTLHSIGQLTPQQNSSHAAVLSDLVESNLGIPKNRLYILFNDLVPSNVAIDGQTRG